MEIEIQLKIYFSSPSKVPLVIGRSQENIHRVHRMRGKCEIWSLHEVRRMETELQWKTYFVPQAKWPLFLTDCNQPNNIGCREINQKEAN